MRTSRILAIVALPVALAWSAQATAATVLIDFNTLAPGQSVTTQYQSQGVIFSTDSGGSLFNAAASTFGGGNGSPLITNSRDGSNDRQTFLNLQFVAPVSAVSFGYLNYGGFFTNNNFKAYDSVGNLLETLQPTTASSSALETISFASGGISLVKLQQPTSGWIFGVDNLRFTTSDVTAAVPEPSTWAMMLLGFGFVGGALRSGKRRQKVTVSYA